MELIATSLAASFDIFDKAQTASEIHSVLEKGIGVPKPLAQSLLRYWHNPARRVFEVVLSYDAHTVLIELDYNRDAAKREIVAEALRSYGLREYSPY